MATFLMIFMTIMAGLNYYIPTFEAPSCTLVPLQPSHADW